MDRLLLLNPPGTKLYIRDYFCSKVSQADYIYQPTDLLMLSAVLTPHYELHLIDAIAAGQAPADALREIRAIAPVVVIMLMGAASCDEDFAFAARVREALPDAKIVAIGDLFSEDAAACLRAHPALDAVLLDFTTDDILCYLAGDLARLRNMAVRTPAGVVTAPVDRKKPYCDGVPAHALFTKYAYRHPFVRGNRFATVLLDFGCPFRCRFCIMKTLGFKTRMLESVKEELRAIRRLGITEILFITQTFGADPALAGAVCDFMIDERLGFGWVCFSRVDVMTPALLARMKLAGCHTIMFGIESGSEAILQKYRKDYTLERIRTSISRAHELGIETVGTFILGLPDEDHETMRATLALLRTIDLDYASFNVAVPRAGTELRGEALANGLAAADCEKMDQSGGEIAMPTKTLSRDEVLSYRRKAVFTFYLRPRYILLRLRSMRTRADFVRQARQALALIRKTWFAS
jgi:radical SAM superfamily enzyme YgiQ (UPF0313 family)